MSKMYDVYVTLYEAYLADDEDDAFEQMLSDLAARKGMSIVSHKTEEDTAHNLNSSSSDFV